MNHAPTGPLGILGDKDGEAPVGTLLTARPNAITDADGMGPGSFQWTRDGNLIAGGNQQKYRVIEADQGRDIGVRYQYIDGDGNQETVISKPVHVPDPLAAGMAAIYRIVFDREPDKAGAAFYARHFRNGVALSELVADMERNKARGAR